MSNFATKSDLKKETGVDTAQFAKKNNLASLKSEVDKLGIDRLEKVPSGLSNVKDKIDKLNFDKRVTVPTNLSKISNVVKNDVAKKDVCNTNIKEIEDKISSITNLATIADFTNIEDKIPNASDFVNGNGNGKNIILLLIIINLQIIYLMQR